MQWKRNAWAVANINLFGPGLAIIEIGFEIVLNLCEHFLQKVQLLVTVIDYDRVGGNEPIGQVLLGAEQKGWMSEDAHNGCFSQPSTTRHFT